MLDRYFFKKHLDDDETVRMVVHNHWRIGIRSLFWPSAAFVGLIVLTVYLGRDRYILYAIEFCMFGSILWWIRNFLDYFLDAWIITNKGVIDVEWFGWFHRTAARILFSDIQGVEYEIHGVMPTLLNYGTVTIEKISTGQTISMPYVRRPRHVESVILEMMEKYMHTKNLKDAKTVQTILAEYVASSVQKEALKKVKTEVVKSGFGLFKKH